MATKSVPGHALGALFVCFFIGCGGGQQDTLRPYKPRVTVKTAYIIENRYSIVVGYDDDPLPESGLKIAGQKSKVAPIGDTSGHIQRALRNHGIESTIGEEQGVSQDVDMIVRYEDVWQWDVKKYLKELFIGFYDARTGEKLVETTHHPKKIVLQTFPTPQKEVPGLISAMLKKM